MAGQKKRSKKADPSRRALDDLQDAVDKTADPDGDREGQREVLRRAIDRERQTRGKEP
jgi:hypothetical protein